MNDKNYIVIHCSEDGDISFEQLTKMELKDRLNGKYYGSNPSFMEADEIRNDLDTMVGTLIIEGKVIVPKAKEVVKTWEI